MCGRSANGPRQCFPFRPLWTKKCPAIPVRPPIRAGNAGLTSNRPDRKPTGTQDSRTATRPYRMLIAGSRAHRDRSRLNAQTGRTASRPNRQPAGSQTGRTTSRADRKPSISQAHRRTTLSEKTSPILSKKPRATKIDEASSFIFPKLADFEENHGNKRRICFYFGAIRLMTQDRGNFFANLHPTNDLASD